MKKINFTDDISDETLSILFDKTLRVEKNKKFERFKINMNIIYKIISIAAVLALFFGIINHLSNVNVINNGNETHTTTTDFKEFNAVSAVNSEVDETEIVKIPVILTDPGIVIDMGYNDEDWWFVILEDDNQYQNIYRRFDEIAENIKIGQYLKKGDIIAYWYGSESDLDSALTENLFSDDLTGDGFEKCDYEWLKYTWQSYAIDDNHVIKFDDRTKITSKLDVSITTTINNKYNAAFYFMGKGTMSLPNNIKIDVPAETILNYICEKDIFVRDNIIIGADDATITYSDGTTSTVPAGTVLDSNGNIVK